MQLERTAGKNALSWISKVFAKFESDFSKTKEVIAPKSHEILQTLYCGGWPGESSRPPPYKNL